MKTHFLTFGDSKNYKAQVERVCKEANNVKVFDYIWGLTDQHLRRDKLFWNKHGKWIEQNPRGYGYWIWKSYLIWVILHCRMNYGDILVYADAGCEINPRGKQRLLYYFDIVKNDHIGILSFRMDHRLAKCWTKGDIFSSLEMDHCKNKGQMSGAIVIVRKTAKSINFFEIYHKWCCFYNLLDDSPSKLPNDPEFVENRHDQSIFSMLCYKYCIKSIPDETWFEDWKDSNEYPILAKRIKTPGVGNPTTPR